MGRVPARLGILADYGDVDARLAPSSGTNADVRGQRVVGGDGSGCEGFSHRAWTPGIGAGRRPQAASLK